MAYIRNQQRVATESIKGYVYQLLHTIKSWLDLDQRTVLVAEGNEDIDELVMNGQAVVEAREIQVKRRGTAIGAGSADVKEKILHSLEAFAEYQVRGTAYKGALLTNAKFRGRKNSQITKWVKGERFNKQKLATEISAIATRAGKKYVAAWRRVEPQLAAFIQSIDWIGGAGEEPDLLEALALRLNQRAPQVHSDIALNALLRRMCTAMTSNGLPERTLRAVDADLALNDAILTTFAGSEAPRRGWTGAIWSHVASAPYTAVAVGLFLLDEDRYRGLLEDREAAARLIHRDVTREQLLEEFVQQEFAFVAYASLRRNKGPRGVRVCLRDVVRQSRHRHKPNRLLIEEATPKWFDNWAGEKLKRRPERVSPTSRDQLWLDLAKVLATVIVADPAAAITRLGTKLRWIHEVESEKYYTADRPTG